MSFHTKDEIVKEEKVTRRAISKIKSDSGASITVALLLFLVCAVIGAVVLTAGTASSGRMSNLAEMDQRYYSVTSAAELLMKELGNKSVVIVREKTFTETTKVPYSRASTADPYTKGSPTIESATTYSTKINNGEAITGETAVVAGSFLSSRAAKLLFGGENCNTDAAMGLSVSAGGNSDSGEFTIEHSSTGVDGAALKVYAAYEMKADGTLVISLSNTNDASSKNRYVLVLTLNATVDEESKTSKTAGTPDVVYDSNGLSYNETTASVTVNTKTTTVTWAVAGIEVG